MKSQIKMGETIAILIIFFFLVVFGFSFYVQMQKVSFGKQQRETTGLKAIQIAQQASFMPELQCSFRNVQQDDCIDLLKLDVFSRLVNSSDEFYSYYTALFGLSNVSVHQVYPVKKSFSLFSLNSSIETYLVTRVPVSLYNATSKTYSFALLEVKTFG